MNFNANNELTVAKYLNVKNLTLNNVKRGSLSTDIILYHLLNYLFIYIRQVCVHLEFLNGRFGILKHLHQRN